jgi:ABC-type branched-subunit amino acid transport system substrate-binding protein
VNAAAAGPARVAAIATAVGAIRADLGASFLGIIGPFQSALSIAIAASSKASAVPWVQMSPASTSPALSGSTQFPYFLRDVPSDAFQGTALAAVLQRFSTTFVQVGLVDPTRRTIAVIHTDDAYAVGVYAQFVAALSQLASGVLNIGVVVTLPLAAYIAVAAADKSEYLQNFLAPVCASNDHVIVGIVSTYTVAVLAAGSAACGMTDSRFLWVGPDVWLSSD